MSRAKMRQAGRDLFGIERGDIAASSAEVAHLPVHMQRDAEKAALKRRRQARAEQERLAVETAREKRAETERCLAISTAAKEAEALGVTVDAAGLMTSGISLPAALASIERIMKVAGIVKLAAKQGVKLDLNDQLARRVSAHDLGREVMSELAARDEAVGEIRTTSSGAAQSAVNRDRWRAALGGSR
ncbi:hypothetical protein [Methylopila sp. Yamaguchi]|uniref:hypothetical protein n=1 Tax=Methylopila sp. Yamaguchi TaxID=1437817 RepID=UPI000CC6AA11|nr:hypothetical protein [Methylopila sp. Yamaguchi]GBD50250.1 hypothetical protein METY_3463 [Methylopila sp. Yamaguchi]